MSLSHKTTSPHRDSPTTVAHTRGSDHNRSWTRKTRSELLEIMDSIERFTKKKTHNVRTFSFVLFTLLVNSLRLLRQFNQQSVFLWTSFEKCPTLTRYVPVREETILPQEKHVLPWVDRADLWWEAVVVKDCERWVTRNSGGFLQYRASGTWLGL